MGIYKTTGLQDNENFYTEVKTSVTGGIVIALLLIAAPVREVDI